MSSLSDDSFAHDFESGLADESVINGDNGINDDVLNDHVLHEPSAHGDELLDELVQVTQRDSKQLAYRRLRSLTARDAERAARRQLPFTPAQPQNLDFRPWSDTPSMVMDELPAGVGPHDYLRRIADGQHSEGWLPDLRGLASRAPLDLQRLWDLREFLHLQSPSVDQVRQVIPGRPFAGHAADNVRVLSWIVNRTKRGGDDPYWALLITALLLNDATLDVADDVFGSLAGILEVYSAVHVAAPGNLDRVGNSYRSSALAGRIRRFLGLEPARHGEELPVEDFVAPLPRPDIGQLHWLRCGLIYRGRQSTREGCRSCA